MFQATEYLQTMRRISKFHDECIQCICEQHGLTKMEATIITFLKNNPGLDTAADMAELRALSKSHISQAVESLCQKGLLARTPDRADRRKMHLSLLPPADPIKNALISSKNKGPYFSSLACPTPDTFRNSSSVIGILLHISRSVASENTT